MNYKQNLAGGSKALPISEPGTTIPLAYNTFTKSASGQEAADRMRRQVRIITNPQDPFLAVARHAETRSTFSIAVTAPIYIFQQMQMPIVINVLAYAVFDDDDEKENSPKAPRARRRSPHTSPSKARADLPPNEEVILIPSSPAPPPKAKKAHGRVAAAIDDESANPQEETDQTGTSTSKGSAPKVKEKEKGPPTRPGEKSKEKPASAPKAPKRKKKNDAGTEAVAESVADETSSSNGACTKPIASRNPTKRGTQDKRGGDVVDAAATDAGADGATGADKGATAEDALTEAGSGASSKPTTAKRQAKGKKIDGEFVDPALTDEGFYPALRLSMKMMGPLPTGPSPEALHLHFAGYNLYNASQQLLQAERKLKLETDIAKATASFNELSISLRDRELALREKEYALSERDLELREKEFNLRLLG
ncbi:hypothetical protein FB451DRAFT_1387790 [Mycena latifolia]|nr:hypothetical protein FB451DRAFT_1387790 [Mycena latifolia]